MCGIYGFIQNKSRKKPLDICIEGLTKLQYRGYDSAGVATIADGVVVSYKIVGKVELLKALIKKNKEKTRLAIAHTRWATHGGLTENNAHPQTDYKNSLALVHNGIIENYLEIKDYLEKKGVVFKSQTDTEVITNLISYNYKSDICLAIIQSLAMVKGSFAIALIHKDDPHAILTATRNCPLAIGICDTTKDVYISSDPSSFSNSSYSTYFMKNEEIGKITSSSITIYNDAYKQITKEFSNLIIHAIDDKKNGHAHFMHKEIYEQSALCREILLKRTSNETFVFSELLEYEEQIKTVKHIDIIACGSSFHAGLIAKDFFEEVTKIPVNCFLASEYRYKKHISKENSLAIIISQSGETADTLAALKYGKSSFFLTIALCNAPNSSLTRECDVTVPLYVGKEISVCSTKAFTGQLLNLYLLAIHFSNILKIDSSPYIFELRSIPHTIDDVINNESYIKKLAEEYAYFKSFFFIGRGSMYPVSKEAALKLKEISYLPAEGLPAGEMKHGPIALIDENIATISFLGSGIIAEKTSSNLHEIKARNGKILIIGSTEDHEITKDIIPIMKIGEGTFQTIASSVAGQLFAYHLANKLGREIDFPRNLAKSVTVE
jgi:glucosamine--fructose-6-phosphate aminotransferase (isomerizing)